MLTEKPTALNTASLAENAKQSSLDTAITRASAKLLSLQHPDGYWVFDLETDTCITCEYILLMHHLGEIDLPLQAKMVRYIKSRQSAAGFYPLYTGGEGNISSSVKSYYALKLAGADTGEEHMRRNREFILQNGGAAKANVFTRIVLAMFQQLPWRGVPYIPVEIMLLPKWFPFHLDKIAYWSRVVLVPLLLLCTFKSVAKNPTNIGIGELFVIDPELEQHYFPDRTLLSKCFLAMDKLGRVTRRFYPKKMTDYAVAKAQKWMLERLNGEDGLGGIFPAMAHCCQAMLLLGHSKNSETVLTIRKSIDKLLVIENDLAWCQPCLSPVWDTGLAILALQTAGKTNLNHAYQWLQDHQLSDEPGDWRITKPDVKGGGWAFQYANPHYPDVDDTALVAFAMATSNRQGLDEPIARACNWIIGMQSKDGGYGAFDVDNTYYYLNEIPFADHGALLDPPTADVSARCLMFMGQVAHQYPACLPAIDKIIAYLRRTQEADGSWFGRWGSNYIYGTWSVLLGLEQTNLPKTDPLYSRAIAYLKRTQHKDGGWGEGNISYYDDFKDNAKHHPSTSFQTAWAVLGLIAAGEAASFEVAAGVDFILRQQCENGVWNDEYYTAPGFPKVFFLKYHGYDKYFPLWALAQYRKATGPAV